MLCLPVPSSNPLVYSLPPPLFPFSFIVLSDVCVFPHTPAVGMLLFTWTSRWDLSPFWEKKVLVMSVMASVMWLFVVRDWQVVVIDYFIKNPAECNSL